MSDNRREQLIDLVKREFIGSDPIDWPGMLQEDGQEILQTDPPRNRYIAGILFPKETTERAVEGNEDEIPVIVNEPDNEQVEANNEVNPVPYAIEEYLEDAEELINRSNAYRQSAISMTAAIAPGDHIKVMVTVGIYETQETLSVESLKQVKRYLRKEIKWDNDGLPLELPQANSGIKAIPVGNTGLQFDITYRNKNEDSTIFTFTLENTKVSHSESVKDDDCFFQIKFSITSEQGFCPLPESQRINTDDEDYWSNLLLYRNIHNYAIGHGCAAEWDDSTDSIQWISTATFPEHEVKPIVPSSISGVSLEMFKMSDLGSMDETIRELELMAQKYYEWICQLKNDANDIDPSLKNTAKRHISNCETCLERMKDGIALLKISDTVRTAFQYMNHAMLLQQLHYNLPLQRWVDNGNNGMCLENQVKVMPDIANPDTWYDKDHKVYGRWRPFQLAFILMNLRSMYEKDSHDRQIVDLIWFPTGGGKTEAYLGLSAYTIFIRRLLNHNDSGTSIIMRYTLRLLTAQQYERASAMICACEYIRKRKPELFGTTLISIGLWVGVSTTPNKMQQAVQAYMELYNGRSDTNPFVMLKCPWCGAQMGVVQISKELRALPGYRKVISAHRQQKIIFQCSNTKCDFSSADNSLPLYVVDESIYENKPTLLLGTVDKFAMLPFRPQAAGLFGITNGVKISTPDLIIQDELHLISGPLGSMVGHYETLINELCTVRTPSGEIHPKIIASTATISRAREQCHNLYGCGIENVFQFPPSGLNAGESFFAHEDKGQKGRKYVGILSTGSSSDATSAIRLFSSLLYAAKALDVDSEEKLDPYWTNVGYFNSIRELGQAATWIKADIDQHLDVMYKRRNDHKRYSSKEEYKQKRRYIWRNEELTSRIRSDIVTASLANLNIKYPPECDKDGKNIEHPIDICLATNMISVGLDVPRLGLMTVFGQPKTTSEYIQATSRVGRDASRAPGVILVLYRPGRPRDKSHYEHFKHFHSRMYSNVEPTSVTPFSSPVRSRALHAVIIAMLRLLSDDSYNQNPPRLPDKELLEHVCSVIEKRVHDIDPDEFEATRRNIENIIEHWEDQNPQKWEPEWTRGGSFSDILPLMYPSGNHENEAWGTGSLKTPTSMRNVDSNCEAKVLENRYSNVEEE